MPTCSHKSPHENLFRRRDFSGELEVFDAAQYFHASDDSYNERTFYTPPPRFSYAYSAVKSPAKSSLPSLPAVCVNFKSKNGNKKLPPPHPRSHGGKLASFLNALFVRTLTKKKNQKSGDNFQEQFSDGKRMRRSSTSVLDFGSTARKNTSSASDIHFPATKTHQERRNLMEKYRSSKVSCLNKFPIEKQGSDYPWMDEGTNFQQKSLEKTKDYHKSFNLLDSKRRNDDYDDAASDSSEDLFDLPNHHLLATGAL